MGDLRYADAGVDIDAGEELVERIKPRVKRSLRREVLGGIGGFGALVELLQINRAGWWRRSRALAVTVCSMRVTMRMAMCVTM